MSSTKRRGPSSGVANRGRGVTRGERHAAIEILAAREVFGLVWLDADLVVGASYGGLVSFVTIGAPVGASVLPLLGLEANIKAVRDTTDAVFELPAVAIMSPLAPASRLNLSVIWMAGDQRYLLFVERVSHRTGLEQELAQQMRARLMAEADATELAGRLTRANRDLEAFASIVSHDLRAPMRALEYMIDELEGDLPADSTGHLGARLADIRAQAQRMSLMLRGLLEYSSAGHKDHIVAAVDTRALVEGVVASLPIASGLTVEVDGDWPVLETLAAPLDLVLRNLVGNAFKHHPGPRGHIRISAESEGDFVRIGVQDDGPGIAPEHHEVVFLPFRRLTGSEDSPGSGMGLALVQRTLEAVGGRLTLLSDPARQPGCTFVVDWPRVLPAH